jgi:hypothetical protein
MIKKLLIILVITMVTKGCCDPDALIEAPCGYGCPQFEVCESGYCNCQPGWKRVFGKCFEDEWLYYGKVDDCHCITELMLIIPKQNYYSQFDYGIRDLETPALEGRDIYYANYNPMPNGNDSIVIYDIIKYPFCKIDSINYTALIMGKYIGNDTFDAWIKWYTPQTLPFPFPKIKDSCHITFVRPI